MWLREDEANSVFPLPQFSTFAFAESLDEVKVMMQERIFFHESGRRGILFHLLLRDSIQTIQCTLSEIENQPFESNERI
jgi:hypothetical protein